jgi:NAD(P) transhydrogenase subunit alpha
MIERYIDEIPLGRGAWQQATVGFSPAVPLADDSLTGLTTGLLACCVGYYVVWNVTPRLHSPLMSVTNAISSVILLGAIFALGFFELSGPFFFLAIFVLFLSSINIFGGFYVTQRMLRMLNKK